MVPISKTRVVRCPATACALVLGVALGAPLLAAGPEVTTLFPAGAARGSTAMVTAAGKFERWPVKAWCDCPHVEVEAGKEKGKLNVTVAAEAPPGACWIRLYDDEGASALRPFLVGVLPDVAEAEPNDDAAGPQELPAAAVVVNGRFEKNEDVDCYAVQLKRGQTLVASLEGHGPLGSPMDASLQIVDARGFVQAHNDDCHGLDPQVVYTAPADGLYTVRGFAFPATPNSSIRFAGAADYIYRLTVTTGGFVDHAWPMTIERGSAAEVQLRGWNLPPETVPQTITSDAGAEGITLFDPRLANAVRLRCEPHPAAVESEPNNAAEQAQNLALPSTVTGRIDAAGDVDVFRFRAEKGANLTFQIESQALGYPLDPQLRLSGADGKLLKESDDTGGSRDTTLTHRFAAEGQYLLAVRDLYGHGGFRYVYRLRMAPPEPDFTLTVKQDRLTIPPGKPLEVPVTVVREGGFSGEIVVAAVDLPDGVTAEPVTSAAKGDTAKSVKLMLKAAGERPINGPLQIVGTATLGDAESRRPATAPLTTPPGQTPHLWVTATK